MKHTARYRHALPHLRGRALLTDGGLETTLLFQDRMALPDFAAFTLLASEEGHGRLQRYFDHYARLALAQHRGFLLEAPTWRASRAWGRRLGYGAAELAEANRQAIALLEVVRDAHALPGLPMVLSGCIGPRGDGYRVEQRMDAAQAADYHGEQIATFAATAADLVSAYTLNYVDEAVGIVRAAQQAHMPVVISFTVETDGRLPDGTPLAEAIRATDAATGAGPVYYMINCAHPTHFAPVLQPGAAWTGRIRGLRANASCRSHAELEAADELDEGDPAELAAHYRALQEILGHLAVIGGCCGTDYRHVAAISEAWEG